MSTPLRIARVPKRVPQPVQLGVLGDARRLAGPLHPQAQAGAVPRRLAVVQEDAVAGVVLPLDGDEELQDDGVERDDAAACSVFLAVLCRRRTMLACSRSMSAHSRPHSSPGRQPVKRRKTRTWRKRAAGLAASAAACVGGVDLRRSERASPLLPDGGVPEERLELVVGQRPAGLALRSSRRRGRGWPG